MEKQILCFDTGLNKITNMKIGGKNRRNWENFKKFEYLNKSKCYMIKTMYTKKVINDLCSIPVSCQSKIGMYARVIKGLSL